MSHYSGQAVQILFYQPEMRFQITFNIEIFSQHRKNGQ